MPEVVAREQFEECAADLEGLTGVRAADIHGTGSRLDRPYIEVTVGPGYERVPPRVSRTIAEHDFGTRPDLSGSRGRPRQCVLVVV